MFLADGQVTHLFNCEIDLQFKVLRILKRGVMIQTIFTLHFKVSKTLEKKLALSNLKSLVRETQKVKLTLLQKASLTDYEQKYSNMMVWKVYTSFFIIHLQNQMSTINRFITTLFL